MLSTAVAGSNVDNKNKMKLLQQRDTERQKKKGIERRAHAQVVAERRIFTYKKKKIIEKILAYFRPNVSKKTKFFF